MKTFTKHITLRSAISRFALFVTAGLLFSQFAFAQLPVQNEGVTNAQVTEEESPVMSLTSLTGKLVDGIVYLKWTMRGEQTASLFVVERSADGEDYTSLGSKEGYQVPNPEMELLYCFSDEQPVAGTSFYRIRQFRPDGEVYSFSIEIKNEHVTPLVDLTKGR
jgi:hypothetical protein